MSHPKKGKEIALSDFSTKTADTRLLLEISVYAQDDGKSHVLFTLPLVVVSVANICPSKISNFDLESCDECVNVSRSSGKSTAFDKAKFIIIIGYYARAK